MASIAHYYTKFEELRFYHIYNRSIDRRPMFKNRSNYEFFLRKFQEYVAPVANTNAFCLMNNHFDYLIHVKDLETIRNLSNPFTETHDIVSHQFRKFFQSYAMAFNKQHQRIGTLFQTPFKRSLIESEAQLRHLVTYIHGNPQKHGFIDDFRDWEWSSYNKILHPVNANGYNETMTWFENKKEYEKCHLEYFAEPLTRA